MISPGAIGADEINGDEASAIVEKLGLDSPSISRLDDEDQTITGGARVTVKDLGNKSSGTVTVDPGDRPIQRLANMGAFTLAPGTNYGAYLLVIQNGATAGAITTSGWSKVSGDIFDTTNNHNFLCHCTVTPYCSVIVIQAAQ